MTTVANKQENTQGNHDDGDQTGYYRSQQEVDHAFGKRLAHERAKWEQAQKEAQAQDQNQEEAGEPQAQPPNEGAQLDGLLEAMAQHEQTAVTGSDPSETIDRATDAALGNNTHAAFLVDIAQQAEALSQEMDFDLAREMENPVFAMLLATGAPLRDVMEYVHPEQKAARLRADAEREVIERIRARNQRPASLQRANASQSQLDVSALSDEQIRDIDRRVKRGERVVL